MFGVLPNILIEFVGKPDGNASTVRFGNEPAAGNGTCQYMAMEAA